MMLRGAVARALSLASVVIGSVVFVSTAPGETDPICTITGTNGGERLRGTTGPDVICGLGGDDILIGLAGDDTLLGGDGNDVLEGGPGADKLFGDAGNDLVQPGTGDDGPVDGGMGLDTLDYTDLIKGPGVSARLPATGSSYAFGGGGTDQILAGFEHLNGSRFDDPLLRAELNGVATVIQGFGGNDTIDTSDTDSGGPDTVDGGTGTDRCISDLGDQIRRCEPFVNQPPVADAVVRAKTNEDTPLTFTLPVSDPDGETIDVYIGFAAVGWLYQVNPDGTPGARIISTGEGPWQLVTDPLRRVHYVPRPNDYGNPVADSYYYAQDSSGAVSTDGPSGPTHLFFDVAPVNDPITARSGVVRGFNDVQQTGFSPDYFDPDTPSNSITGRFTEIPRNGNLILQRGGVQTVVTPATGEFKMSELQALTYEVPWPADCRAPRPYGLNFDSLAYEVSDGEYRASASHTINIEYRNEPPVVDGPMSVTTMKNEAREFRLQATDPDGTTAFYRITKLPEHGELFFWLDSGSGAGPESYDVEVTPFSLGSIDVLGYRPDTDFVGEDSFTWEARDKQGSTPWCGATTTKVFVASPPPS